MTSTLGGAATPSSGNSRTATVHSGKSTAGCTRKVKSTLLPTAAKAATVHVTARTN
jgi:hypothetical protein